MAVVKMHKASDGSLHESFEAFAKHETGVKIAKACDGVAFDMSAFSVDDRDNEALYVEGLGKFIADNADTLRDILNASVVSRRGRKGQ